MKKVGITGGIGSGKSTVSQAFQSLGIPIYCSDIRSKMLVANDTRIISGLKKILGDDIYSSTGQLDKRRMAAEIFTDKTKLERVNSLIHPIVNENFALWAEQQEQNGAPYVINEAAIMIENGSYKLLDHIIIVTAPLELRIQRCIERDHAERTAIEQRINNQIPENEKLSYADDIIITDDRHFILPQILEIHERLKQK